MKSTVEAFDGGPVTSSSRLGELTEDQRKQLQGDTNWLKYTSKRVADDDVVRNKMKKTAPLRQEMVSTGKTAGEVIEQFPKYLEQSGLVSIKELAGQSLTRPTLVKVVLPS